MGRLPKKINTNMAPKLALKAWVWIGVSIIFLGICVWYNASKFQPSMCFKKPTPMVQEPMNSIGQMEAATPQDLQALPIAEETAEETIAIADFQNDALVQVFEEQEQNAAKTDPKPKAPLVMKRSLGLV